MRNALDRPGPSTTRTGRTGPTPPLGRWADWVAPPLILLTLLIRYVKYHRYPLATSEILLCTAALLLAGVALCLVARLRRETLYPLVIGILVLQFADVHFHLFIWAILGAAQISPLAAKPLLMAAFFAFMFLIFVLRREIGRIVTVVWGVILVSTVFLPSGQIRAGETVNRPGATPRDLPLVLHIVLDEQIGVEGIPGDLPGGARLRHDLASQYLADGFEVHGRAFSHYSESQLSLASLLNAEVFSVTPDYVQTVPAGYRITKNDWLRSLNDEGYSIRIYESGWIDFCQPEGFAPDYCFVYPTNSVRVLRQYDLDAWTKARLVLPRALIGSLAISAWPEPQLSTLSCLPLLDRLAEDIRAHPRGVAFFVHLLLPHYAYAFDAECRLRPDPASWVNVGDITASGQDELNSEAERAARYQLYFQQVRCVTKRLGKLLAQLADDGSLETATVIVHGDHGSRLARKAFRFTDPVLLSDRDMVDHYSTLMAIRLPDGAGAYSRQMESIQRIFARRVLRQPLSGDTEDVFMRPPPLSAQEERLLKRRMVDFAAPDPFEPAATDPEHRKGKSSNAH